MVNNMRLVQNEKGIALITALLFMMLSLGIVMTLLYMVTMGTKMTAANKSYKTSLEASYGATDILAKDVLPIIFRDYSTGTGLSTFVSRYSALNMDIANSACLTQKTRFPTANWNSVDCEPSTKSATASEKPDITFKLKATNDLAGYNVYTKIIDTKCGGDSAAGQLCSNSKEPPPGAEMLSDGSSVASGTATVKPQSLPAYYRIDIQGERALNPHEKTKLSVLYAY